MTTKMLHRVMVVSFLLAALLASMGLMGCARHPSPEEMNQLEMTKAAALSAEEEAEKKSQEREEWEAKLEQKEKELQQAEEDLKAVEEGS